MLQCMLCSTRVNLGQQGPLGVMVYQVSVAYQALQVQLEFQGKMAIRETLDHLVKKDLRVPKERRYC